MDRCFTLLYFGSARLPVFVFNNDAAMKDYVCHFGASIKPAFCFFNLKMSQKWHESFCPWWQFWFLTTKNNKNVVLGVFFPAVIPPPLHVLSRDWHCWYWYLIGPISEWVGTKLKFIISLLFPDFRLCGTCRYISNGFILLIHTISEVWSICLHNSNISLTLLALYQNICLLWIVILGSCKQMF